MKFTYDCPKLRIGIPPKSRKLKQVWSHHPVELDILEVDRARTEDGLRLLDKVHVNVPGTEFIFIDGQCYRDLADLERPSEYETATAFSRAVTRHIVKAICDDTRYIANGAIHESNLTNAITPDSISSSLPSVPREMNYARLGDESEELEAAFDAIASDVISGLAIVGGKLFTPCKEPMHTVVMFETGTSYCGIELDDTIDNTNSLMPKIAAFPLNQKDEALEFATWFAASMCHNPARLDEWFHGRISGGASYRDDIHELNKRLACRNLARALKPDLPDTLAVNELLMRTPIPDIIHYRMLKEAEAMPICAENTEYVQSAVDQAMDYLEANRANDPSASIALVYRDLLSRTEQDMGIRIGGLRP